MKDLPATEDAVHGRYIVGYGGGKGGGGAARAPVEARDSLRSRAFANVLLLVAEGPIGGLVNGMQSAYVDGTPVQNPDGTYNIQGVTMQFVNGTATQPHLVGYPSAESEIVVGAELKANVPLVRQISNANVDVVRVRISIPNLSQRDLTNGDLNGATVQLLVEIQPSGGSYFSIPLSAIWTSDGVQVLGNNIVSSGQCSGIAGAVTWTREERVFNLSAPPGPVSITYNVEYRLIGSGAWTFFRSEALTDYSISTATPAFGVGSGGIPSGGGPFGTGGSFGGGGGPFGTGGYFGDPPTSGPNTPFGLNYQQPAIHQIRTYEIAPLTQGMYEMRVIKTGGDGEVSLSTPRIYVAIGYDTITGKASSPYERSYLLPLNGPSPWNIRLTRLTPDSTISTLANQTFWESYTEIIDEKLTYKYSAVAGIRIDSTQFRDIPTLGFDCYGYLVRIPSNYDPITRTYSGLWNGSFKIAWSDNPAWCFYEVITNTRWGLGGYIDQSQVDKAALYTIGQYCDGLVPDGFGGLEPRFRCGLLYLQTREEALKVITSMASIFRAMVYWAEGTIRAVHDAPSDALKLFSESNVVDGLFRYQGSARKARHTVALVTWNDPLDMYRQKVESVEDPEAIARYGYQPTEIVAVGCTSRGQALRVGKWLLFTETKQTGVIIFRTGMEGVYLRPGDVFGVNDQHRAGLRNGGRIIAATSTAITVDAPLTLDTGIAYTLFVVLPTGITESRAITSAPGEAQSVLTVSPAYSAAPQKYSQWQLKSPSLEPTLWRAISIAEIEPHIYEVNGLEHNASKYSAIELGTKLQLPRTSAISIIPDPPRNIRLGEDLYVKASIVAARLIISWDAPRGVSRFFVEYRKASGNWIALPEVTSSYAEANDVTPDLYQARVSSVNAIGARSSPVFSSQVRILGKAAPPPDVLDFLVSRQADGTREATWSMTNVPLDVTHGGGFRIRYAIDNPGNVWANMLELHKGLLVASPYEFNQLAAGTYDIAIKMVDSSGNESINEKVITTTLGDPRIAGAIEAFDEYRQVWDATKTSCHVEEETGFLVANGTAVWSTLPSTWSSWTRWNYLPASPIVYERTIDIGLVTSFTPLVTVQHDGGTLTLEEAHKDTVGGSYTSYVAVGPMLKTRFIKIRITLAGSYPVIRSALLVLAADAVSEDLEDINSATLTGAYRIGVGDIRLPITKAYAVIRKTEVTMQNVAAGFSAVQIDKDTTVGPRWKFYNGSNALADLVFDAHVRGL